MTIRFFAAAAEVVGSSLLDRPDSVRTVGELRSWLNENYPQANSLWVKCLVAIDQSYASDDHPLKQNDDIAIIPPVSGG